uniref:CCT domain-containing protein n=1 Tax=Populus trichocarpa TaxID=3694 RepID=A0A3N7EDU3_POPTR
MYGNNTFLGSNSSLSNSSGVINTRPLAADQLVIPDPVAAAAAAAGIELGSTVGSHCTSSTASGCSSYGSPSSLVSGCCSVNMQRSISSHSFQKNGYHCHFASHPHDFLDMDTSPVRRVFSTGDLQHGHRAESPLLSESSLIIESMSKACKYSPEEKKERIERYRSKRNQRNFNKKIKEKNNSA